MEFASLSDGLRRAIRQELRPGEQVRWAGRPRTGRFVLGSLPVTCFGIFFAGFAAFWIAGAYEMTQHHRDFDRRWNEGRANAQVDWGRGPGADPMPAPRAGTDFSFHDLFPLFGPLFLGVGLGMVFSPLFMIRKALSTAYAVTDRRVILFNGGWSTHVRSLEPAVLGQIERRQHADGSGDLILMNESHYVSGYYSGTPGRGGGYVPGGWATREIGFFGIRDVRRVEEFIRELASRGPGPTPKSIRF